MKKLKFYISLILLLSFSTQAKALSDINISGEADLALSLYQLPTRVQGTTAFSIPSLKLDLDVPLRDNNELFIELESAEYRDATSHRYDTQVKEAYVTLTSFLPPGSEVRYGLIPDFWIERQREQWDYDFWGMNSYLPMIKYKYDSWSDLGLMYEGELFDDWGPWVFRITNGEGLESDEIGPRKQAQLLLSLTKMAPFYVMLSYSQGAYDNYGDTFNDKRRAQIHLSYEFQRGLLALEYYMTKDPADAITDYHMAKDVDVVSLHGTNVEGQGASLYGKLKLDEKWNLFLRGDWLNPVKTDSQKWLQDITGGFSYDTNEDLRWALSYEYTHYSDQYTASPRDEGQFVLATRVNF